MGLGRWPAPTLWEEDTVQSQTSNFERLAESEHDMATDGSGGPRVPKQVRRVGAAVAIIDAELKSKENTISIKDLAVQTTSIPGRQTVPRAELYATIKAKQAAHKIRPAITGQYGPIRYTRSKDQAA